MNQQISSNNISIYEYVLKFFKENNMENKI